MNRLQFALFTLLQETFEEREMLDTDESSERLEQYLLQRFRKIYHNTNVNADSNSLEIRLNNFPGDVAGELERIKEKVYVDFRIELDTKDLARFEELLSRETISSDNRHEIRNILSRSALISDTVNAIPHCHGQPVCRHCKIVTEIMRLMVQPSGN